MKVGENIFANLIQEENQEGSSASGGANDNSPAPASVDVNQNPVEGGAGSAQEAIPPLQDNNDFETQFQSKLFELAKSKGREITSVDDLFKAPEKVEVIKNQYENVKPEVKSFLDYHSETGRNYDDYLALQKDISAISDLDLAREKVRLDSGKNLTDEQVDAYIEKKLNIDLSDLDEIDMADQIELSSFTKGAREAKIEEQKKYKTPLREDNNSSQPVLDDTMVELETGERMPKKLYEDLVSSRNKYVESINKSVDSITQSVFNVVVDDNGAEKTVSYGYDYSKDDRQNMLSMADNLEATVDKLFKNEGGEFNHSKLMEGLFWLDEKNREKAIVALAHKIRAEVTLEVLAEKGNVNFGTKTKETIPGTSKGNKAPENKGFGVKYNFNPKN